MPRHKYYDLSSDNDSDDASYESLSSHDDDLGATTTKSSTAFSGQDPIWGRTIVHLDIDCFYVQAEEIERGLRDSGRPIPPLAIGQKHIIVTSNYLARSLGVKKLQSKREALETCPNLWIVDGSDLRHYRKHSRAVYQSFRSVMEDVYRQVFNDRSTNAEIVMSRYMPCVRGCMDEMMGDLSHVVNKLVTEPDRGETILAKLLNGIAQQQQKLHIFGEDLKSSVAYLVEDQTGVSTTVSLSCNSACDGRHVSQSRSNVHETHNGDRLACRHRFQVATELGQYICHKIQQRTQFHTTIGLSVSPLLAKLACGLTKPNAINVLFPWRTADLLHRMPLRKMPNVGHRTMKVLDRAIREECREKQENELITVGDLLRLPKETIVTCLSGMNQGISSEFQCNVLLERCRGLDSVTIIDDEGGATKTVSVEDSCRRGTVKNMDVVWKYLDSFFVRLPQLLLDRVTFSPNPKLAFPSTLRLTVRLLDPSLSHKRRPYVTRSKQVRINGKVLMDASADAMKQASLLKEWVTPLVKSLLIHQRDTAELDVTRINLAVTNFADITSPNFTANTLQSSMTAGHGPCQPVQQAKAANSQSTSRSTMMSPPAKRQKIKTMTTTRIDQFFLKK
ncbi:impB/mucB/samB family protein [Nitzschia inconspicua]|uniref:ImpB/mucB/samB family protein n=1 Tax=Nitzschia inconspicua TaxID=303405 RepID=A0A9K3PQW0_9STRA|nr:impB/mucB/samB family protein [Nitzschia inconspicua]